MKRKNKLKSKAASKNKQLKKELTAKLSVAFNEIVAGYGKVKKADQIIEKLSKQLTKNITLTNLDKPVSAEVDVEAPVAAKEKAAKAPVKKTKTPAKESAE